MKFRNAIFILLILSCFTRCKSKNDNSYTFTPVASPQSIEPRSFVGIWTYSIPFYSSELSIKKDGTFQFHDHGCTAQSFTEGTWKLTGRYIELTSFAKYKPDTTTIPIFSATDYLDIVDTSLSQTKKKRKQHKEYHFTAMKPVAMGPADTSMVYFDKILYGIDKDTLYHMDSFSNIDREYTRIGH